MPKLSRNLIFPLSKSFKDFWGKDFFVLNINYYSIDSYDNLSSLLSIYIPNLAYSFSKNDPLFRNLRNFLWTLSYAILFFIEAWDSCKGASWLIISWRTCSGVSSISFKEFYLKGPLKDKINADFIGA